jgi:hypothetical protein
MGYIVLQTEEQKTYYHLIGTKKANFLLIKNISQIRNKRNVAQHNKCHM